MELNAFLSRANICSAVKCLRFPPLSEQILIRARCDSVPPRGMIIECLNTFLRGFARKKDALRADEDVSHRQRAVSPQWKPLLETKCLTSPQRHSIKFCDVVEEEFKVLFAIHLCQQSCRPSESRNGAKCRATTAEELHKVIRLGWRAKILI